jgi:tetrapyrrole methylase family protein/MazG family protein
MNQFERLVNIMGKLRSPEGCPWDLKQDHKSLRPYLIEEAYEVVEAINSGDDQKLKEELGDLLLQIVFHARLAEEKGHFDISDVAERISEKIISRHPHVFEKKREITPEEVLHNWEHIKIANSGKEEYSVLEGVPKSLPALLKAYRVQEKVARFGFDWEKTEEILDKIREEIGELEQSFREGEREDVREELGDLLFSIVNLCRRLGHSPEEALNSTTEKFKKRFQYIEDRLREMGKSLSDSNLEEMDKLWEEAKRKRT